ncbi:MAG: proline--tRNA ligase [Lentisphaeria bacterium]
MKLSKLVGKRIKEVPKEAQTTSHIFMIRGGYVRPMSAGIYSLLPLGKRIASKVEKIIREEMDKIDGQECLMPVVMTADLWRETGRYQSIGDELLRFKDRNDKEMVLAMTHEEAFTSVVRSEVSSYKQLPVMLYQLQTKYRDEARPRAGLIRVREFTMKDAYSFHSSQSCLESYYNEVHQSYEKIFQRLGMNNVVSIESDSGMMGGSVSHEFMALAECGEDILFLSPDNSSYKANREIAVANYKFEKSAACDLEEIHTPNIKSIVEVAEFLNSTTKDIGKAVVYSDLDENIYLVMIRGDFEVNEAKLKKAIGRGDIKFATDEQIISIGSVPGYSSALNINLDKVTLVCDKSIVESSNLTVGANKEDYHIKNFNFERDLDVSRAIIADIITVRAGDPCPVTGEPLVEKRGIEVGNIFQLGTKYSKSMGASFLDQNGKSQEMIMGCYGIGVGRSVASVIEGSYDEYGPIWPISIAPYHVHICALNANKEEVKQVSDKIYHELQNNGIEVLIDDRNEKAGFMFNDADLIGIPHRLVISPKSLKEGKIEYKSRDGKVQESLIIDEVVAKITDIVYADLKKYI